ncbi:MAG: hypothetical protein JXA89_16535, partial [Anaerolineae bacterium]|nr:hypothetical protein [Anaerolineae bacterium]
MNLRGLLPLIHDIPAYQQLLADIERGEVEANLSLLSAARPYIVAALAQDLQCPIVLVMSRSDQVTGVVDQLRQWLSAPERVLVFSEPEALPYERIPWAAETIQERLRVLAALTRWEKGQPTPVIVTSTRALMQPTLPRREFVLGVRALRVGQRLALNKLLTSWLELSYEMVSVVEIPGTFSRRGGMIDVFSPNERYPARVELFGDEVDSLRTFDPATQRSLQRIDDYTIVPASEAIPRFGHLAAERLASLDHSALHGPANAEFGADLAAMQEDQWFRGIEFYIPYLYSHPGTLFDFVPQSGLIVVDDQIELRQTVADQEAHALELKASLQNSGELPGNVTLPYLTWDTLHETIWDRRPLVLGYGQQAEWLQEATDQDNLAFQTLDSDAPLKDHFSSGPRYGGQLRKVIEAWREMRRSGYSLVGVTRQASRLGELWHDQEGGPSHPVSEIASPPEHRTLTLVQGTLDQGWVLRRSEDTPPFYLFTDAEIFGWSKPRPRRPRRKAKHP